MRSSVAPKAMIVTNGHVSLQMCVLFLFTGPLRTMLELTTPVSLIMAHISHKLCARIACQRIGTYSSNSVAKRLPTRFDEPHLKQLSSVFTNQMTKQCVIRRREDTSRPCKMLCNA